MRPTLFGTIAGGGGAVEPIALIAHGAATAGGGLNTAIVSAIDTTGATLLVAGVAYYTTGVPTLTDSKGNTWTQLTVYTGTSVNISIYYCANPVVGSGHTFQSTGSNSFTSVTVSAWSLTANAAADGGIGAGQAVALTVAPGNLTPSEDNCLLVSVMAYFDQPAARTATVSAGWTLTDVITDATTSCQGMAYQVQTTATVANPTWTPPQNQYGIVAAQAAFKHV
jgi:hypothetical protein